MIEPHRSEKDAAPFLELVGSAVAGILASHHPKKLYLIHIDNWFDHKWLEFSGKTLGALGTWKEADRLKVPPFVPNRVLAQQCWVREADSGSLRFESAPEIHAQMWSAANLQRRVSIVAPDAALIWYTGNTAANLRGAIMAYIPEGSGYRTWYANFTGEAEWRVSDVKGIAREEFRDLLAHRPPKEDV